MPLCTLILTCKSVLIFLRVHIFILQYFLMFRNSTFIFLRGASNLWSFILDLLIHSNHMAVQIQYVIKGETWNGTD